MVKITRVRKIMSPEDMENLGEEMQTHAEVNAILQDAGFGDLRSEAARECALDAMQTAESHREIFEAVCDHAIEQTALYILDLPRHSLEYKSDDKLLFEVGKGDKRHVIDRKTKDRNIIKDQFAQAHARGHLFSVGHSDRHLPDNKTRQAIKDRRSARSLQRFTDQVKNRKNKLTKVNSEDDGTRCASAGCEQGVVKEGELTLCYDQPTVGYKCFKRSHTHIDCASHTSLARFVSDDGKWLKMPVSGQGVSRSDIARFQRVLKKAASAILEERAKKADDAATNGKKKKAPEPAQRPDQARVNAVQREERKNLKKEDAKLKKQARVDARWERYVARQAEKSAAGPVGQLVPTAQDVDEA